MKKKINYKNGFTIIETLVSIGIFVLLMSAITVLFISLYSSQSDDMDMLENSRMAGRAVEVMSKEIRETVRGEDGGFHLIVVEDQNLSFYSDIDNDDLSEKVTYNLDGTELIKTVVEPGEDRSYQGAGVETVLCSGVRNYDEPIFLYYDEDYSGNDGDPMSFPVNNIAVKTIGISLYIKSSNISRPEPLYIQTKVQPRNLK